MQHVSEIRAEPTEATGSLEVQDLQNRLVARCGLLPPPCVCAAMAGKERGPGQPGLETHAGPGLDVHILEGPRS